MGFLGGSVVKNLPVNTGDMSSIPGLGTTKTDEKTQMCTVRDTAGMLT